LRNSSPFAGGSRTKPAEGSAAGGVSARKGRPGVTPSGWERILGDAQRAAAVADADVIVNRRGTTSDTIVAVADDAKTATAAERRRRTLPYLAVLARGRAEDAAPATDQGLAGGGGGGGGGGRGRGAWAVTAAAAARVAAGGGAGSREAAAVLEALQRMTELATAHDDVARRLQVLRLEGPGGLAKLDRDYRNVQSAATAASVAAVEPAAMMDAAAPPPPPSSAPLELLAVEERGRQLREQVAGQSEIVGELVKVPLRQAMRRAAAAAEAAGEAG
ncbi:hypothetical protein VaNZ11_002727, partial [Volvox africanus]